MKAFFDTKWYCMIFCQKTLTSKTCRCIITTCLTLCNYLLKNHGLSSWFEQVWHTPNMTSEAKQALLQHLSQSLQTWLTWSTGTVAAPLIVNVTMTKPVSLHKRWQKTDKKIEPHKSLKLLLNWAWMLASFHFVQYWKEGGSLAGSSLSRTQRMPTRRHQQPAANNIAQ